ncbi:SEC-C domain-containing protein [Bacillus cereus]|nr:SEC-C domain-containing protein [Bacillus cereus]MEC2744708.1 SEC-C domain-containing protein [Bacillus cereus]MEC2830221.1 SEC-C domain-containing protein [Bacillus cereus]
MNIDEISSYLQKFKNKKLNPKIIEALSQLKIEEVNRGNQLEAKNIWCLEQVYKVINHFITAYSQLVDKKYFQAWCELDRADIELYFLRKHLNYNGNKYNLEFIEKKIYQLQKLFPYKYFLSRESVVKNWTCSICNQKITIRHFCEHKIGEIYNGEMCGRIAGDIEFQATAIVTNPFDKYAVIFPEEKEYNYAILENLMLNWHNPFEQWTLIINKELNNEYKNLGRNDLCVCKSGNKYKNCCQNTEKDRHDHLQVLFLKKDLKNFKSMKKTTYSNWKN